MRTVREWTCRGGRNAVTVRHGARRGRIRREELGEPAEEDALDSRARDGSGAIGTQKASRLRCPTRKRDWFRTVPFRAAWRARSLISNLKSLPNWIQRGPLPNRELLGNANGHQRIVLAHRPTVSNGRRP